MYWHKYWSKCNCLKYLNLLCLKSKANKNLENCVKNIDNPVYTHPVDCMHGTTRGCSSVPTKIELGIIIWFTMTTYKVIFTFKS